MHHRHHYYIHPNPSAEIWVIFLEVLPLRTYDHIVSADSEVRPFVIVISGRKSEALAKFYGDLGAVVREGVWMGNPFSNSWEDGAFLSVSADGVVRSRAVLAVPGKCWDAEKELRPIDTLSSKEGQ